MQSANYNVHGYGAMYLGFNCHQSALNTWTYSGAGSNGSALIWNNVGGELRFGTWDNPGGIDGTLTDAAMYANTRMRIQNDGKVVIGAPTLSAPGNYKLYVQDGILTERVKVSLKGTADWADYVFAPTYHLRPLTEVADSIAAHQHLPGVPSAAEMAANGLDVVQTDRLQQEKIEELFLYVIELQRQLAAMKQELAETASSTR